MLTKPFRAVYHFDALGVPVLDDYITSMGITYPAADRLGLEADTKEELDDLINDLGITDPNGIIQTALANQE